MDPAGSTTAELQNCRWYFVSHQFGIVIDVVTSCIAMVFVAQGELQMTRSQGRIKRIRGQRPIRQCDCVCPVNFCILPEDQSVHLLDLARKFGIRSSCQIRSVIKDHLYLRKFEIDVMRLTGALKGHRNRSS